MVDPERHADKRNVVESILHYVPGFRGYLEKEYRRESDQLARTWMAGQLRRCKTSLDQIQRALVDNAQIDALPQFERIRTRLDTLESRVRGAMRGYSGFFDFVTINEARLDAVYRHDMSLMTDMDDLARDCAKLISSGEAAKEADAILARVESLHSQFDERSAILQGLSEKE